MNAMKRSLLAAGGRRRARRRRRAGAGLGQRDQDRRAVRHVEPVHRPRRRRARSSRRRWRSRTSGIEKRGIKVEIVSADHQNKPDVGSAIARQWYDADKVDVIVDVPNSGVALAVNQITQGQGQGVPRLGPGIVGPDRQGVLAQHGALDLRHLDARQRHRQRDRQDGRRHLVLHHRRLRVRPCARARHRRRS